MSEVSQAMNKLLDLAHMGCGGSMGAMQVLRAVHQSDGQLDWYEFKRMDREYRDAAMVLLNASANSLIDGLPLPASAERLLWPQN